METDNFTKYVRDVILFYSLFRYQVRVSSEPILAVLNFYEGEFEVIVLQVSCIILLTEVCNTNINKNNDNLFVKGWHNNSCKTN